MHRLKYLLPLAILLVIALLLLSKIGKDPTVLNNTLIGQAIPVIVQPDLFNSQRMIHTSQLPAKPYLLNVWASWCPTCLREHPFLVSLSKQGVVMVGMNYQDEAQDATAFLLEHGNPFQLVFTDKKGDVAIDLGLTGTPETYVVDAKGIIHQHVVGELSEQIWQTRMKPCYDALVAGGICRE